MSKISRIILSSVFAIAVLFVAGFLYVNHGITAFHHERIEAALSDASGFRVRAERPFDLSVGRQLSFSANELTIDHEAWTDSDPLASIADVHVTFNTWSALTSPWGTMMHIDLSGVAIHMQETDGRPPNWVTEDGNPAQTNDDRSETMMLDIRLAGLNARGSRGGSLLWSVDSELEATAGLAIGNHLPAITLVVDAPSVKISTTELSSPEDGAAESQGRVFSDAPIDWSFLTTQNLSSNILANDIQLNDVRIGELLTTIQIVDGSLQIENLQLTGEDASVGGSLLVKPTGESYSVSLNARLTNWRAEFLAIDDGDEDSTPPFDGELELSGTGSSLQAIMASANGRMSGRHSSGAVDLTAAGPLFSDVAASLIETLNPLAESSAETALDCGVYEITVTDGLATIEQFSVQTDKLTVISSGEVDLSSEAIDMALRTKSREGLGLTLGSVATSFFKLGGTLSEPSVNVDASGTVTTAGAAAATGGLSLLAKGLWDRLSAEADLCQPPSDGPTEGETPEPSG